jgi:L-asparagine transporter-like permease
MMVTVAQIRLRRERERTGAPVPALQMWLFPWASYAAIGGMLAILVAMAFTGQAKDLYVSLVTLVVAVAAYLCIRARRARSTVTAPV